MSKHLITPIAIDLGASSTGVYSASYFAGAQIDDLNNDDKVAFVAQAPTVKDKGYKLLQRARTENRHALRGRTRRKQAKKLLLRVLEEVYEFPAARHYEAIAHFMNRRGFSYMEAQVDLDSLDQISDEFCGELVLRLSNSRFEKASYLFDTLPARQAISQLACEQVSDLKSVLDLVDEWGTEDRAVKKQAKPIKEALEFYIKDLTAGAKHRAKYFSAIKHDIALLHRHPLKPCRKLFYALQRHQKGGAANMVDTFYQLLCHINNFDLKLLNRIDRSLGDGSGQSLEAVISEHFGRWLCKHWSLSSANGEHRCHEIRELQTRWRDFSNTTPAQVFSFFEQTDPEQTIPPYESHTNRRPPRCQTLILNAKELKQSYPQWRGWLATLTQQAPIKERLTLYHTQLAEISSGKGNPLVSELELEARQLQLILDTSQGIDPFKLNLLWSQLKKRNQLARASKSTANVDEKLKQLLDESKLPQSFKKHFSGSPSKGGFWHLVNRYYQARRKAKSGRYFLYYDRSKPETKRWQTEGNLLSICQHRPRQLRHQSSLDIAALLGIAKEKLLETDCRSVFGQVRGLKTACQKAQKAQKTYGADLKQLIATEGELVELNGGLLPLLERLAAVLGLEEEQSRYFCERNHSLFIFAQLYALVWGERSGFGKSCPVCSQDNASRMVDVNQQPQAARLSTLSLRLIDGGLARLLTHQAHHIANRLWPSIEARAKQSNKVTIPLLLEQNRFNFAASLHTLKDLPAPKAKPTKDVVTQKRERIRQAVNGICPYTGVSITEGDIDHIIPRSGAYGVLNDEANLIFASQRGNREVKKNRLFTLSDLSDEYLTAQFGTTNLRDVTDFIEQTLWNQEQNAFVFGRYYQFIGLTETCQKAFRHALFLPVEHPLRALVIDAIGHRSKARVNGTQRFMAQLLADVLTAKARKSGLQAQLSFDYVEVSSNALDEDSTVSLRRHLSMSTLPSTLDLSPYAKVEGQSQHPYSHVIDAMMAFMLALDKHQGEGAMRLGLKPDQSIWGEYDESGVITAGVYEAIAVPPSALASMVEVKPRSAFENVSSLLDGAKPHEVLRRPVFKKNAIGLEFYDLCEEDGKLFKGFYDPLSDAGFNKASVKPIGKWEPMLAEAESRGLYRKKKSTAFVIYHPNKAMLMKFLFNELSEAKDRTTFSAKAASAKLALWLLGQTSGAGGLYFYSTKEPLEKGPKIIGLLDAKAKKQSVSLYERQWRTHYTAWLSKVKDTPIKDGEWIIAPEHAALWSAHCNDFLTRNKHERMHMPKSGLAMKAETAPSGALGMVKRSSSTGDTLFQLVALDNSTLSPEQAGVLAMNSPNLVLLNKDRISKGYLTQLAPEEKFEPQPLLLSRFIKNAEVRKTMEGVMAFVPKPTRIEIQGLTKEWFEKHLLVQGDSTGKRWHELKSLAISKTPLVNDAVCQTRLSAMLARACKTDKAASITIKGNKVVLGLPYDKKNTLKLLAGG